jgi:hypothetical protein
MAKATEVWADENRVIERVMSADELAEIAEMHEVSQAAKTAADELAADKAMAKAALLERLGITADEAALLLS